MTPAIATRRVLVVGIDGVRFDTLAAVATPNLDDIAAAGFLVPITVEADAPSLSGPGWATVATGVTPAKHGVYGNDLTNNRLAAFPDFATVLHRIGLRSYVAAGWEQLVTAQFGGPLFAAPSRCTFVSEAGHNAAAWEDVDEHITTDAESVLTADNPVGSFVYLGAPDMTAHYLGCGDRYRAAIEQADARLGRIVTAVRGRRQHADEAWTIIVVTDHGHVDEGGHGGDTPVERTAWIAACGPTIAPLTPDRPLRHVDIVPSVYTALGLPLGREAAFDGAPFTGGHEFAGRGSIGGRVSLPV